MSAKKQTTIAKRTNCEALFACCYFTHVVQPVRLLRIAIYFSPRMHENGSNAKLFVTVKHTFIVREL